MKPIFKPLAVAGIFAIATGAARADAPVVTFTTSGTVAQGYDQLSTFVYSSPGADIPLAGMKFTMSITVDTSKLTNLESSSLATTYRNDTFSGASKGELTINGRSYSWTIDQSNAEVSLYRPMEWFGREAHSAYANGWGNATDGMKIWASSQVVSSKTPFLSSVDIARNIVFDTALPGVDSYTFFQASRETDVVHPGGVHETEGFWFQSVEPLSSATWTVSAVPEPGQYAMLLFGVVALAHIRRKVGTVQPRLRRVELNV
ncbi:MAG: PEP-CTERM sorting domain-containing protein [Massilia sp.]